MSVESRLVAMENELKALKQTMPLSMGALKYPDNTPTASYSGSIDTTVQREVLARISATFTRTDGLAITPMVDFAYSSELHPTLTEFRVTQGLQITGNDPNVDSVDYVKCYEADVNGPSVTVYIDVSDDYASFTSGTATISVQVQAISTVEGSLSIARVF